MSDFTDYKCKLDNGKIRHFDSAIPVGSHLYDNLNSAGVPMFRYIGDGCILSIKGKPITDGRRFSFYRKNQL